MTPTSRMERARELFGRALELPVSSRRAFIDSECQHDPELRREVLELLSLDEREEHAPTIHGEGMEWLARQLFPLDEQEPAVPETLGEFRVVRKIGQGGMGIVYEVAQERLSRRAAIKIIHPGLLGPGAMRRFHRETKAMAALTHPGIVRLYEVGAEKQSDGIVRPYLVMELVDGQPLRRYVETANPTVEQRLQLLADLCDAVHHAHQKGIVHRDLKPDNILVADALAAPASSPASASPRPQPKILDFGVSRLIADDAESPLVTRVGQVVGTAPYMSPEQAEGDALRTDTRSDVFALGVIAFELLTGRLPVEVEGMSTSEAIRHILNTPPARLRAVLPSLHPDLQTIVHKAMHREVSQRYASAAEFGADIRRFLSHQPVLAREPSWTYVTSRFVRRHRTLTSVIVLAAIAITASVLAMGLAWADARRTREAAIWQRYRSTMSAASSAIAAGDIATARRELEASPEQYRGWEFRHLTARLDQSRWVARPAIAAPFSLHVDSDDSVVLVRPRELLRVSLEASSTATSLDSKGYFEHAAHCGRPPQFFLESDNGPWQAYITAVSDELRNSPDQRRPPHCLDMTTSRDGKVQAMLLDVRPKHVLLVQRADDAIPQKFALHEKARCSRIRLSPDGTRLFLASAESDPDPLRIHMIDVASLKIVSSTPPLPRVVFSLAPLGHDRIAAVLQSGDLESWDLTPSAIRRLARAEYSHDAAENLTLSADGRLLASASRDGLVRVFDAATLGLMFPLSGHESEIVDVGFTPDSRRVVSSGRDGTLRQWDVAQPKPNPMALVGHQHLVHPLAFSPSRKQVITGSWDHSVSVFNAETGTRLAHATLDNIVLDVVLSPDERLVLARELGGKINLFRAETLDAITSPPDSIRVLEQPAFDQSSQLILLGFDPTRCEIRVWDVASRVERVLPSSSLNTFVGPFLNHHVGLVAMTNNREGERVSVIFRYADGKEIFARHTTRPAIESIAFSPNGRDIAIVSPDHRILVLDARTLEHKGSCVGHTREVLGLVFSPDGSRLFSSDLTGAIRVWDTRTWEQVALLLGHESHVRRLITSNDGRHLISGSRDGTARIWTAP